MSNNNKNNSIRNCTIHAMVQIGMEHICVCCFPGIWEQTESCSGSKCFVMNFNFATILVMLLLLLLLFVLFSHCPFIMDSLSIWDILTSHIISLILFLFASVHNSFSRSRYSRFSFCYCFVQHQLVHI